MKISYRWIREFVDLDLTPEQAAERLVHAGIEVESVTPLAPALSGVVVAEIEAIECELGESHGHRLLLCRVSTGHERFTVVCGAPNTAVGLRAAFAPPGATLPDGRRIAVVKIHGTESQGMLCSEREMGIGDEHEAGILVVDPTTPLGTDLRAHLGLDDSVLEVEITPNRPDCLSVVGVARELSALTGARFSYPALDLKESDEPVSSLARVRIEDPDLCHRFTARVISDVTVARSPVWLATRLRAVGLRPITNVVDITNYVMWELGHPLHAFDSRAVSEATIVVRRARPGEHLTTLDGQDRVLDPSMLLIADPARGVGIAGVMGGANTEVTNATTRVLLESAYFQPGSIRRTSRALGLRSDAAYRFERGADIEALVDASARAARLMSEICGGVVARGMIDVYPRPRAPLHVRLRRERVQRLIGVCPPWPEARRILTGLGLPAMDAAEGVVDVEVPSFRRDIAVEDDLVEEVIRVWGYEKIPLTLPGGVISPARLPATLAHAQTARRVLVGAGLLEAVTSSLSDPARVAELRSEGDKPPIALLNPLSQDAAQLRQHPLEGLLGAVAINVRRQQPSVRLFEVAPTYERVEAGGTCEPRWVAIALAGARSEPSWYASGEPVDVYDVKGLAEHVLDAFGVETTPGRGRLAGLEPDVHGALAAPSGAIVAEFGEVAATVRERFGLEAPVFAAVIALDAVSAVEVPPLRYRPLPRYPAVQRDMAFAIASGQAPAAATIERAILDEAGPLLREVTLFDVFPLPDGGRSLAWRLTFQADDRTLTDDEVNAIHQRVARHMAERFHITLRGS